jgi:hypothetical protein
MAAVTGLSKESFATDQAVKLLRALGFEVKTIRFAWTSMMEKKI